MKKNLISIVVVLLVAALMVTACAAPAAETPAAAAPAAEAPAAEAPAAEAPAAEAPAAEAPAAEEPAAAAPAAYVGNDQPLDMYNYDASTADQILYDELEAAFGPMPTEGIESLKVGFVTSEPANEYWQICAAGMEAFCADNGISELNVQFIENLADGSDQLAAAEAMLADDYDIFIFNPCADDLMVNLTEEIKASGKPVIDAYCQFIDNTTCFVGGLDYNLAALCAQELTAAEGDDLKIVIVQGDVASALNGIRVDSFVSALPASAEVVTTLTTDWSAEMALNQLNDFILTGEEFDAVYCCNGSIGLGAIEALNKNGMGDIPVGVLDLTTGLVTALQDGQNVYAVDSMPFELGQRCIEIGIRCLAGQEINKIVTWDGTVATKDNIGTYDLSVFGM